MIKKKKTEDKEENEIGWRAAEYDHIEKGGGWYATVGAAVLILLAIALWQKNFFFGIFILLAGIIVITLGNRRPDVLDFKLTGEGCEAGRGVFHKYEDLKNFCLKSRPNRLDELVFRKKTAFNPFVRIPVDSRTAEKARIFLVQKLPEVAYEGSLMDALIDFLGF